MSNKWIVLLCLMLASSQALSLGTVIEDVNGNRVDVSGTSLQTNLRNSGGTEVGTAAAPLRFDPTGTTTQPVSAASLPLPTGAATSANQSTEITALQLIDDAVNANDSAMSKGVPIMGQLDDTSTGTVTENNVSAVRETAARALHINVRNNAGTEMGTVTNPFVVTGDLSTTATLLSNQLFTTAAIINAATAGTDNAILYFRNPSGSGVNMYIIRIVIGVSVANVSVDFKFYADPTSSANGTTLTGYSAQIKDSPASPAALTTTLPTITANGNLLYAVSQGQNATPPFLLSETPILVAPNHKFIVTASPSSNNRSVSTTIVWAEVPL